MAQQYEIKNITILGVNLTQHSYLMMLSAHTWRPDYTVMITIGITNK